MTFRPKIILILILALVLFGCSLPALPFLQTQPTPAGALRPEFVNHPAPAFQTDLAPFKNAGCMLDPQGRLRCPPNEAPFDQMGCFEIVQAPDALGGLNPTLPVMLCVVDQVTGVNLEPDQYLYNQGCRVGSYVRLVIYKDGQFQLIHNLGELKATFAPIETPDEAVSYAAAATGFQPKYGLKDENMRYLVARIEDTQVQLDDQSRFVVNLYAFDTCGCGPHAMNVRLVKVSPDGSLVVNDPQPVWEDPTQDGLCVD